MKIFITVLAIISAVSFSTAGVSANQPYDFGISIVELSDSTTTDNIEKKKWELKTELRKKNKKALVSAATGGAVLLGGIGLVLMANGSSSGSSSSSTPWVAVDFGQIIVVIAAGVIGTVIIVAKLIYTLVNNQADYKRSLKKLSNPAT
ncbi:MAG TPA: hypothetical protein EYN28_01735 [Flavobacteriales bacterium]|nr:hypothetical protein [Flavobacteriales bacterium]HIB76454.1 hypothetical protein [Flavobacteriales bacterium]HIO58881.1 hypothetical protein [Flavobacteriales bacterium]